MVAALLCSREMQMFPQSIEERGPVIEGKLVSLAVNSESHRRCVFHIVSRWLRSSVVRRDSRKSHRRC